MQKSKSSFDLNEEKEEIIAMKQVKVNILIDKKAKKIDKLPLEQLCEILIPRIPLEILNDFKPEDLFEFVLKRFDFLRSNLDKEIALSLAELTVKIPHHPASNVALEFHMSDAPFVLDSLIDFFHKNGYRFSLLLPPVLKIKRNDKGEIVSIHQKHEDERRHSILVCCVLENFNLKIKKSFLEDIQFLLRSIHVVTGDFRKITESMEEFTVKNKERTSESLIESERRQLFQWFIDGNMILLGAGELHKENLHLNLDWKKIDGALGYVRLKKELKDKAFIKEIGKLGTYFLESNLNVNLIELQEVSPVHRRDKIQVIFGKIKRDDGHYRVAFYLALFTNKASREYALAIPSARLKVNHVLDSFYGEDHMLKEAKDFFSTLPKSELFRLDRHEMGALLDQIQFFGDIQKAKLYTYCQLERRYARLTLCFPTHGFSPKIFEKIEEVLNETLGLSSEIKYFFTVSRVVYSHHLFWFPKDHPQLEGVDLNLLESKIALLTKSWNEELNDHINQLPLELATKYYGKYDTIFNSMYQAIFSPSDAILDIEYIDRLVESGNEQVDLRKRKESESIIYIYSFTDYHLTEIMPHLQNLSLVVMDENTFKLAVNGSTVYLYTFYVRHDPVDKGEFLGFRKKFCELFLAVLNKTTEDDPLNGLLFKAKLDINEINLFILFRNYYWQIGTAYSKNSINSTFLHNPHVIHSLKDYFFAKFDPAPKNEPLGSLLELYEQALISIFQVKTITEDITFKNILNFMHASVRTNYFTKSAEMALAVKINSMMVDHMPLPRPMFEIYVHGVDVEGIHLRGAKIARGGIRHSDRPDDFRTEILGLMKTQMMKNVVIVPEGSKGGFFTKRPTKNRGELMEEGKKQYQIFINGLLSLTDNIVDGKITKPKGLVIYDEEDPYLVVAADKGTAHLSDTANEISQQNGFWLKDAFASGGKDGYDHKKIGITARGAWECVKLHFLEMGKDIQNEIFTVVGIGDMSGDVFGNGMLLSQCTLLVGAFNHIHVFVDPTPDPKKSWKERKRLFEKPGTTWMDYNKKLISQGGGVFERSAKSIKLTPEMKELFETDKNEVNGEELIKLLMKSEVDLLWNGGIGTYIKSSIETSHQVGDPSNDMVRVSANEIRAKVIGEGGNLGLTQHARIEFFLNGGKLNTDAIDNSGGVDISDHEVNLKILLFELMKDGQIKDIEQRNELLHLLEPEITELTLRDNIEQGQVISMDNLRSAKDIRPFIELIQFLSRERLLDRRTENISSNESLIQSAEKGLGASRPDLAVVLSYTKMYFYKQMVKSDILEDPYLHKYFVNYFPRSLFKKFDIDRVQHPLAKEIIATMLVNSTINQSGVTLLPFVSSIVDKSQTSIVVAHAIVNQSLGIDTIRENVMRCLGNKRLVDAYKILIRIERIVFQHIIWMMIRHPGNSLQFSLIPKFQQTFGNFLKVFEYCLSSDEREIYSSTHAKMIDYGLDEETAQGIARLESMRDMAEIAFESHESKLSIADLVQISKQFNDSFHYLQLQEHLFSMEPTSQWAVKHRGILVRQLQFIKQKVTRHIVNNFENIEDLFEFYGKFLEKNKQEILNYQNDFKEFVRSDRSDLNGAAVLLNTIMNLFNRVIVKSTNDK